MSTSSTTTPTTVVRTPLPRKRLAVLAAININEGFQVNVIWPFIPFYVQSFYGMLPMNIRSLHQQ
jgi:hypothetical protein